MKDIKIYVCYHQAYSVEPIKYLLPIQVGASLNKPIGCEIQDNSGVNISHLNASYCELTALYWMWKNSQADYYGLFHYRRYLEMIPQNMCDYKGKQYNIPYKLYRYPHEKTVQRIGYKEEKLQELISNYDIIMPIAEEMYISVYDHYTNAPHHHKKDLDSIMSIIKRDYPEYTDAMYSYLKETKHYFGNIFIANKKIFDAYCAWVFDILGKYDAIKDTTEYSKQEIRVDGYLAERLLGIYYTYLRQDTQLKWAELPRAHFETMGNTKITYYKKKVINALLRPGSKRRMAIKNLKVNKWQRESIC